MTPEQRQSFLKDEYFKLQDYYEDYDKRSLTIKSWISVGAAAAIAIGLDPTKNGNGILWIIISAIAPCFWYLEIQWKLFQYALSDRIRIIEAHFRREKDILVRDPPPLQIFHSWFKSHKYDRPIFEYEK